MFDRIGEKAHGFTVTRIRSSKEIGGRLVEMTFDRTGTELCWVDNGETNKLFSITFKTVPENSTGVFHILEHSVLCGSEKYPVREPFLELMKSSMNTFLNAMTFPDKTMYPISSRNEQDFLNLTEVYLDAVFAPSLLRDPNIFYQEGWHLEVNDGVPSYKGVVFNEMKGATSGVERILQESLLKCLFPDTCYRFRYGGDPAAIPDLSYEAFCDTYRRFYHPSNARIFLDGAIPCEETFALMEAYLSRFERSRSIPVIGEQKQVGGDLSIVYELDREEELKDKEHLTLGRLLCDWRDREKAVAAQILLDAVAESNDAPLKRPILSSGLAQEMEAGIEDGIAQPLLCVHFRNVQDGKEKELISLLQKTASELAEKGLDREALAASASRLEFRMRDLTEPAGLERCILALNGWLYGGDPMQYLTVTDLFRAVRSRLDDGSMENLLRELFLGEEGLATVVARPSHTRGEELRRQEADRLSKTVSAWSDADRENNRAACEDLLTWQQTPDSPEKLATIPVLPLSKVSPDPIVTKTVLSEKNGVKTLFHPVKCGGIAHLNLYFSLTDRSLEELSLIAYVCDFLGEIRTARRDALSLQNALKNTVGHLDFSVGAVAKKDQIETCTPQLIVKCSVLESKWNEAIDLIREILLETDLTQRDKIWEILSQVDEKNKQSAIQTGHLLCHTAVSSHYSAVGAAGEAINGYSVIRALRDLINRPERFDSFLNLAKDLREKNLVSSRLTISVTADEEKDVTGIVSAFPAGTPAPEAVCYSSPLPLKMGCRIPSQIGYSAQACQLSEIGGRYNSAMQVTANLVSLNLMWGKVRVQGGAYDAGLLIRPTGVVSSYSYRDPTPVKSLGVNREISSFLREFCAGDESLDKYIISTIAGMEPLRSPASEGQAADTQWFAGRDEKDIARQRREILSATREMLTQNTEIWDRFARDGAVCVIGFEDMLTEEKDLTILEL